MDPLRDFDDARTLGEPELRARLRDGAPVERVWCAWQLGLRRAGSHDFAEQVKREPHPGVRRHLAVAVAGAHDVDVLVVMARHDPDSGVRSTAMLLATRFAAAGLIPWAIIEAGLADEAPGVREAIVGALPEEAPGPALLIGALADASREVRRAAIDRVLAAPGDEAMVRGACALLDRAAKDERTEVLTRWRAAVGTRALAEAMAHASAAVQLAALAVLPGTVAWREVAPMVERADPAVVDALDWRIDGDLAEVPLAVLLRWLVSGEDWRLDARLEAAADQLCRDRTPPPDPVAAAVARVTAVRAAVLQDLAHPDPDDSNPDLRSPAEATAAFDRFLAATARHA
ncbi:MAG: hypothetical protein K8W52_09470 [Deltaproteobacteria bacterium]|nr:hypothetical protein [Deltaproteobacteria bacterium]